MSRNSSRIYGAENISICHAMLSCNQTGMERINICDSGLPEVDEDEGTPEPPVPTLISFPFPTSRLYLFSYRPTYSVPGNLPQSHIP